MPEPFEPPLVIFDLDGVLVDSWGVTLDAFAHAYHIHTGRADPPLEAFSRLRGVRIPLALAAMQLPAALEGTFHVYAREHVEHVTLFAGVAEILSTLDDLGHPLAICTLKDAERTRRTLDFLKIRRFFQTVVTPERAPAKPDAGAIRKCLSDIGSTPDQALFVGDTSTDMIAGRSAGVKTVFARWGALAELSHSEYTYRAAGPQDLLHLVNLVRGG